MLVVFEELRRRRGLLAEQLVRQALEDGVAVKGWISGPNMNLISAQICGKHIIYKEYVSIQSEDEINQRKPNYQFEIPIQSVLSP